MSILPTAKDIENSCVLLGVQRAARRVARRYDEALRPVGLTSGQFSILSALLREHPVPISVLAEVLGMDRTTLNRNLKPLTAQRWIEATSDPEDARVRGLALTTKGRALLEKAIPLWLGAQADSESRIGRENWPEMRAHLRSLV